MMSAFQFALCFLYLLSSIVASPPKLLPLNNHYDLVENITFPLTCSLLSDDGQSTTFSWFANGVQLKDDSNYRIDSSSPKFSFLTIPFVQRLHSGLYECRAVNSFGESDVTRTKINVQGIVIIVFDICSKCGAKACFGNIHFVISRFHSSMFAFVVLSVYSLTQSVHNDHLF